MIVARTTTYASDVAFTDAVKAIQARKGSRSAYSRMEVGGSWERSITDDLKAEIESQISVFLGTANAAGQPYIQHRGGPPGFLRVLDEQTIAFADLRGNRQFITQGDLAENPKAHLFLIDYANRQRIKVWGEAHIVEDNAALLADLLPDDGSLAANRSLFFGCWRGMPTAPSTFRSASTWRTSRERSRSATSASLSWRPRSSDWPVDHCGFASDCCQEP